MNSNEHLLTKLAEEGVEIALELSKVTHKTMLFGPDEVNVLNPDGPSNKERIVNELNDLIAAVEMLAEVGVIPTDWLDPAKVQAKKDKVRKFMEHARQCGTLDAATSEPQPVAPAPSKELTATRVDEIFRDCLFNEGEDSTNHVVADGITMRVGFHPERLEGHKVEILELLHNLSDDFREDKGGGMSFLNACETREGVQWGEHRSVEQLMLLGIATGQAKALVPREKWTMLPGGMPYFSVKA